MKCFLKIPIMHGKVMVYCNISPLCNVFPAVVVKDIEAVASDRLISSGCC